MQAHHQLSISIKIAKNAILRDQPKEHGTDAKILPVALWFGNLLLYPPAWITNTFTIVEKNRYLNENCNLFQAYNCLTRCHIGLPEILAHT